MTVDETLDNVTRIIGSTLRQFVLNTSTFLLPYALSTYVWFLDMSVRFKKQSCITMKAVVQSFKSESILFYKYGNAYAPVLSNYSQGQCSSAWLYTIDTSTFYNSSIHTKGSVQNLPILGASLCYLLGDSKAIPISDLSEWIADQKVHSNTDDVPLQVLVSAWSYCTARTMYYNFENYVLLVTDLEGEEKAYKLETGESIPIPTIETSEVIGDERVEQESDNQEHQGYQEVVDDQNDQETKETINEKDDL
jgi:hypothetical protein